ncbi:MAG TPA: CocE/NonD family hydrolase [Chitinophagaceae bacterium]|nr:CocE/NonD family hydrolase [Chitinophagaceae bacterium]
MRKVFLVLLLLSLQFYSAYSQTDSVVYSKRTFMIPMRDGVRLNTVFLQPVDKSVDYPIILSRTPYGASFPGRDGSTVTLTPRNFGNFVMAKGGYIFVAQDIRGKFRSEGTMEIHEPLTHATEPGTVDESTDTWDTIDWLIKNVTGNNGKVGIYGISYPGWLALVGSVDPHPALKASSEQACMSDLFLGDDFHHNGAFRLSYGMEYSYELEFDLTKDSDFSFPQYDLFDWYLQLGSLKNVNEKYFHGKIPTWNNFTKHPNYDEFWKKNSTLSYVPYPEIPQLHVGGYYDQEDINGPQLMYSHMEKKDSFNRNFLVLGPWNHGQWGRSRGDSLGNIAFGSNTGVWFRDLQKKWFDKWLKGVDSVNFSEAYCFQTGSNQWKTYTNWPPEEASIKKLYAAAGNKASFDKPGTATGFVSFISDPAKPVPYRMPPIEATYGTGSRWRPWHVEDQRFIYSRPDVISFMMDPLTEPLVVTGKVIAHLFASTSATDADWVVKLIDVYPDKNTSSLIMSGYQLPVAMEVFRGRFRKSFSNPSPLTPGKAEEFIIDLHDINHVFLKGHRIMIQVQSTWFPVIDRNPQKYVPNIFEAKESDYIKAEHKIYFNSKYATYIELPVMKE